VTYTAAAVLGVAIAVGLDLFVLRTRLVRRAVFWATYPIVIAFQLLSNGVLTGRGIVLYNPHDILGLRLVHAPVEDLLFGFALVLLTLSLWVWWGRRGIDRTPRAGEGSRLLAAYRARKSRSRS
jgi:lycopene cyclase domain-containing protein